jgi:multidrug efflux pump subunit AcrA (membrane-fusion protein)
LLAQIGARWPSRSEVLVTTVAPRDVPVIKEGVATLNGFINATISARVSGYVISQNYEQGSVVKKGDLLFQIDPRPFQEALAQAEANLADQSVNALPNSSSIAFSAVC